MPAEGDAVVDVWRSTIELPLAEVPQESRPRRDSQTNPLEPSPGRRLPASLSEWAEPETNGSAPGADDPLEGSISVVIPISGLPAEETTRHAPLAEPPSPFSLSWTHAGHERVSPLGGAALPGEPAVKDARGVAGVAGESEKAGQAEEAGRRFRLSSRGTGAILLSLVEGASARAAGARSRFALLLLLVLGIFFLAYLAWR